MSKELLNFFYKRSNLLKSVGGFTQTSNSKWVVEFNFIISNIKTDEENTIEIKSIEDLKHSVREYFINTKINALNKISYSKVLNENNKMFVHLILY